MTTIREYEGKTGIVTVTRYDSNETGGHGVEYHVTHSNGSVEGRYWTMNKAEAIAHAQFLSRY